MIKYKYYFIDLDKKFKILGKNNNLSLILKEIKEKLKKNKKKNINKNLILLKLTKFKNKSKKSILKLKTGPIRVDIINYYTNERCTLKISENKTNNYLYYTEKYLEKYKIRLDDLRKIAKASFKNKLEKRLLAPKLIDQIKKIKL